MIAMLLYGLGVVIIVVGILWFINRPSAMPAATSRHLDTLVLDRYGLTRRPGETDAQLRERARMAARPPAITLADIAAIARHTDGVNRAWALEHSVHGHWTDEGWRGEYIKVVVYVEPDAPETLEAVRDALEEYAPAGIVYTVVGCRRVASA